MYYNFTWPLQWNWQHIQTGAWEQTQQGQNCQSWGKNILEFIIFYLKSNIRNVTAQAPDFDGGVSDLKGESTKSTGRQVNQVCFCVIPIESHHEATLAGFQSLPIKLKTEICNALNYYSARMGASWSLRK